MQRGEASFLLRFLPKRKNMAGKASKSCMYSYIQILRTVHCMNTVVDDASWGRGVRGEAKGKRNMGDGW